MKLRSLYEQILTEIGDSIRIPSGAGYRIEYNLGGYVTFEFGKFHYIIEIGIPVRQENSVALLFDFSTMESTHALTNQHDTLKLMSIIVGAIETWCSKYSKKYFDDEGIRIPYIKYDPKSEKDEVSSEFKNKRDRLYRAYIERFAKKYGSNVEFSTTGGVTAKFNPPLTIK